MYILVLMDDITTWRTYLTGTNRFIINMLTKCHKSVCPLFPLTPVSRLSNLPPNSCLICPLFPLTTLAPRTFGKVSSLHYLYPIYTYILYGYHMGVEETIPLVEPFFTTGNPKYRWRNWLSDDPAFKDPVSEKVKSMMKNRT
jgi:hypothetical protein